MREYNILPYELYMSVVRRGGYQPPFDVSIFNVRRGGYQPPVYHPFTFLA